MFGNRLNLTVDWYNKVTDGLLRERNIAPSSGYDRMWVKASCSPTRTGKSEPR